MKKSGWFSKNPFENDVLISFPKSGRTWLRVMLDELGISGLDYIHADSGHKNGLHMDGLDTSFADKYQRILFLYRDPRDTAVSGFHHCVNRLEGYDGDISKFLRDPHHGIEKILKFNSIWIELGKQRPEMLVVSYEKLKEDACGTLREIAAFFDHEVTDKDIDRAIDEADFEKMKARERSGFYKKAYGTALTPKDPGDENSYKVRRGKVGGFRDELSEDDIEFCQKAIERFDAKAPDAF